MNSYGFRIYSFDIYKGRARKCHPLHIEKEGKPDWWYRDHLLGLADESSGVSVHGMPPRLDGEDRSQDLDAAPVFQMVKIKQVGDRLVGSFRHGKPAGHDLALPKPSLGEGVKPIDISAYSPTREYRFVFYFPDPGEKGILAVEAVSGACPTRYLVQWARWWSQSASSKAWGASEDKEPPPWFNLKVLAMGDSIQVNAFIEQSKLLELVLVAGKKGASRIRSAEEFRITSTLDVQGKASALSRLKSAIAAKQSDEELAEELAKLLGRKVEDIDLDDGWLVLDTEYGKQQVSPTRIPDVFTYPIAETHPSDPDFYAAVRTKASELSAQANGTFDFG